MNKEKTKILTERGDIYNSCPYIDNLIDDIRQIQKFTPDNINQIQEYTADSVNQLEYIRDINEKLREELEEAKNECVELNDYVQDVEFALNTSSKKETVYKIESLQDEIISNLENQIKSLQDEIEELNELNNE